MEVGGLALHPDRTHVIEVEQRHQVVATWELEKTNAVSESRRPCMAMVARLAGVSERSAERFITSHEAGASLEPRFDGNLSELDDTVEEYLLHLVQSGLCVSDDHYRCALFRDTGIFVSVKTMNRWLSADLKLPLRQLQADSLAKYTPDNMIRCVRVRV